MSPTYSELEEQNAKFKQRLTETQSLAQIGSWDWNVLTNEVEWSDMMYLMLGLEPNTVVPSYEIAFHHVHDDDKAVYEETLEKSLAEKAPYFLKNRIIKEDNTIIDVISRGMCILDDNGNVERMMGTVQDRTEQIIAEQYLMEKEKALERDQLKSQFLANVSHEIRNPLNAILGFSQLLSVPDLTADQKENYLELINSAGTILKSIISNTLDISKIEAKQLVIIPGPCNLNEIMRSLQTQFKNFNSNESLILTVKTSFPDDESNIVTDSTQLIQILSNLLENAQKFTTEGSIDFGYDMVEDKVQFFVSDSGMGIDPKDHQKIFDTYGQLDRASQNAGVGLGLSICKQLVGLLGGEIWLESEVDKGATFKFTIPYTKLDSSYAKKESSIIRHGTVKPKTTILVAEDIVTNFKYLEIILKEENYEIIRAKNGLEAVDLVKAGEQIDLILMDIRMPKMDGITATEQIQAIDPSIPIIMQSGDIEANVLQRAMDAGCKALVVKPFSKHELYEIIEKQLEENSED